MTVNVEPRSSSGSSAPVAGCLGEAARLGGELVDGRRVAVPDHGDDEPLIGLDGEPEVVAVEVDDLVTFEPAFSSGNSRERQRRRPQ